MAIDEVTVPKTYVVVQATEPTGVFEGQLWFDNVNDITYIYQDNTWTLITLDVSDEITDLSTENAEQQIEIIELQANASVTPFDHSTLLSDTFNDADGFLDSVNTTNTTANFNSTKYERLYTGGFNLNTDLLAYYKFDEASGNASDELSNYNLTNTNTATYGTGKLNNSAYVDGTNQYLINTSFPTSITKLSVSGWIYEDSLTTKTVFALPYTANTYSVLAVDISGGKLRGRVSMDKAGTTGFTISDPDDFVAQTWYHWVLTFENNQELKFYINGVLIDTKDLTGATLQTGNGHLLFGALNGPQAYWNGRMDEFAIWDRVLTDEQALYLYKAGAVRPYSEFLYTPTALTKTIEIDLTTISGTVTATELVVNGSLETGSTITYKLNNDTTDDTEETINTKNNYNLTGVPTKLKILLNPKATSPTDGSPNVTTYCLKLWKV